MLVGAARRVRHQVPGRALAVDAVLAALAAYAAWLLTREVVGPSASSVTAAIASVVAVLHGASVGLRRVQPWAASAALLLTAAVHALALGIPAYMLGPAVLFVAYGAGSLLAQRPALLHLAALEAGLVLLLVAGPAFPGPDSVVLYALLTAAAWFLGALLRRWQLLAAENARRAVELDEARLELARHAVAAERLRIARELHDIAAHNMSVISMHAGAARLAVGNDHEGVGQMLGVIEQSSQGALAEMRRLVTVLRDAHDAGSEDAASPPEPAPGLGDLHELVAGVVAAGLTVDVRSSGALDDLPPGVSLAAYRVLQEALTNVVRHAGVARARLIVAIEDDVLRLLVEDDGPAAGASAAVAGGGHGMVGMRERVELYGGRLSSGPRGAGGWRVEATIPIKAAHVS